MDYLNEYLGETLDFVSQSIASMKDEAPKFCPNCGAKDLSIMQPQVEGLGGFDAECKECGYSAAIWPAEKPTCDNCGSEDGYRNSSGEWQCDNCGYSESE